MAKKVLILMADTGGGHRACADALRTAISTRYAGVLRADAIDVWSQVAPWPLSRAPRASQPLVDRAPWLWRRIYEAGESPRITEAIFDAVWYWTRRRALAFVEQHCPAVVVSVHALLQDIPLRALSEWRQLSGRAVPFVTIVTDLVSTHPVWFDRGAALCIVPTDEARGQALRAGLRPDKVRQYGLPIRPEFARVALEKHHARRRLGLRADLPLVLLLGGGEGMGRMEEIAQAVATLLAGEGFGRGFPASQLAVICGRNRCLQQRLSRRSWPIPTAVRGFEDRLWEWMAASEFAITKAGPSTIMEACASGLPLLLSGYVPGQEEGNVKYVVEKGAGSYASEPETIAEIARSWLRAGSPRLDAMARRARELSRPDAASAIADDVAALAGAESG